MLRLYRKLPIATKLIIAGLAMLIPLGTLGFFMQIGFRYDISIGEMELVGTQYLRDAYRIQHLLSNHNTFRLIETLPSSSTEELEIDPAQTSEKIDNALNRLADQINNPTGVLAHGPKYASNMLKCIGISRMREGWAWYATTGRAVAFDEAASASLELITLISNCANLALDPALDSQMLARATVNTLPQACEVMSRLQWMALEMLAGHPDHTIVPLTNKQRTMLIGDTAYYQTGLFKRLLDDSRVAMVEDANFYTFSPTLTLHYGTRLDHYKTIANQYFETASRMEKGEASPAELFNAAARVRSSGYTLFLSAMDEMDILIQKRIDGYETWRLFGTGLSLAGLLSAILLLIAASRSISSGVKAVVGYTQRVARGDYDAKPDFDDLGPQMRAMVTDTGSMVTDLKDKIGYLNGILHGMTVPCLVVDTNERITFVNQPALDLGGRKDPLETIIGMDLASLVYDEPGRQTVTGRCMQQNKPIRDELINIKTVDGAVRHIRFDVAPLHNLDDELIGAFIVITDLTEIKEKELSIERLAAFPREAPDPVLSAGPDGAIQYLNTSASVIFESSGLAPDQNFLPEGHADIVATCLKSGTSRQGIEAQVGNSFFSWTYHPLVAQQIVHMYATDITKRIRAEKQLLHDAFHDALTGLPNKALFLDRVNQAFRRARQRDIQFAILFLDLDGFKNINDGLGHSVGDKVLARFAWRIKDLLGPDETLARLGGDEFTILLPAVTDDKHGLEVANRIQGDLKRPFAIDGTDLFISASIGVINAPDGANDASDLLRDSETAMYRAKALGRAHSELFDPTMHEDASERIQLENDLKRAVENNEFEPYFQPIVSLQTGRIAGFEALIRWNHPTQGIVSPARFIPLAEETGLIVPMGAFMLESACRQVKQWQDQFIRHKDLSISVNMSVKQMTRPHIGEEVLNTIKATGISPHTVKIEITESSLMNNVGLAADLMKYFHKIGVSLMIDDFGTGYSSLSHLHQFPFHFLKIDQSFVSTMEDKPDNMEIVRTIVSLAHTLEKQVVAEGVETESQIMHLKKLQCEFVQGYYYAHPLTSRKAEELLAQNPKW